MKDSAYTLTYAAVLGIVCSALLTGVGRFTKPYRDANAKAEEVRNILGVLNVPVEADASAKELVAAFEETVQEQKVGDLKAYVYRAPGSSAEDQATAVAFSGPGLWGPIRGFLALESDLRTIRGVTFHEQEETPGLGGEIGSAWFRGQFRGKKIQCPGQEPGLRIARGKGGAGACEVDGISGATGTCEKVEVMLNAVISRIVKETSSHAQ